MLSKAQETWANESIQETSAEQAPPLIVYTLNRCTIKTIGFLNKAFKCSYGKMTSQGVSGIMEKKRKQGGPPWNMLLNYSLQTIPKNRKLRERQS